MADSFNNGCIVVLCGIPGSGKSTLSQNLLLYYDQNVKDCRAFVISYDKILPTDVEIGLIEGGKNDTCNSSLWKAWRQSVVLCVDHLIQGGFQAPINTESLPLQEVWTAFKDSLSIPLDRPGKAIILVDDNMYYSSMRYQYYQLARKYQIGFCQIYMKCNVEDAMRRNEEREEKVPTYVIEEMAVKLEPPDPDKNHWEKHSLTFQTHQESPIESILSLIEVASQNPVEPLEEVDVVGQEVSRQISSRSLLHQIDQILRKLVASHIQQAKASLKGGDMKLYAVKVNKVKTEISDGLRTGLFQIPEHLKHDVTDSSKETHSPLYTFIELIFKEKLQPGISKQDFYLKDRCPICNCKLTKFVF